MRAGLLLAAFLAAGASASAQQANTVKLDARYTGVWAVNGSCDDVTFVFAETFIERAGEDICWIEKVETVSTGVNVIVTCWHEGRSFGKSAFNLRPAANGKMSFANTPNETFARCGPVPKALLDFYVPERSDN